jgi:hypothetical protein
LLKLRLLRLRSEGQLPATDSSRRFRGTSGRSPSKKVVPPPSGPRRSCRSATIALDAPRKRARTPGTLERGIDRLEPINVEAAVAY